MNEKTYYDIFAGIGLVDYALLSNGWTLSLALDHEEKKYNIFKHNFNGQSAFYEIKDIFELKAAELPKVFLGHASFPCTDVSSAGKRVGVQNGKQSSAIDSLLGALYSKHSEDRPSILLTENVKGLLTSNQGKDIRYLLQHYNHLGYRNDIFLINAKYFVPQSRERVFIISTKEGLLPEKIQQKFPQTSWMRSKSIIKTLKDNSDLNWTFLTDKQEPQGDIKLKDIVDKTDEVFWDNSRAQYLYNQMPSRHQKWIENNLNQSNFLYATAFRRMRIREGIKQSTAELRTDNYAGCLRTTKGGSAKQILIRVGKGLYNARLINAKEAASLMGAPNYAISKEISLNDYLFAFGDGVCSSVIKWLDENYLTPIYENQQSLKDKKTIKKIHMDNLTTQEKEEISKEFSKWCDIHSDKTKLPIKGRLYGALVVLHNLTSGTEEEEWGFEKILNINSTDKGSYFGDRSIKNHTSHKINLALSTLGRQDLIPTSGGEAGRTSTGTKRAGLDIIQLIAAYIRPYSGEKIKDKGMSVSKYLNSLIIEKLEAHAALGGIEVSYSPNETIGKFLSKIIHYPSNNSGAILQHLVGAKLELRYKDSNLKIEHHKSTTADFQTNRKGDFDIGNSVIHVTKSPTIEHFKKAILNAKAGRTTYLLIPQDRMGTADISKDVDPDYKSKVNIYSIEQFLSQNIDELSQFKKEISIKNLSNLLEKYNELIEVFENDKSLKIIIPDFGE